VAFSPDRKTIAAGYGGRRGVGGVVLWDVATRKRLSDDPLPVKEGLVRSVAFSPDGKTIAAGYDVGGVVVVGVGGVVLWDVATRKRLSDDPLPVKEGFVRSVAFSPDRKTIAAGYGVVVVGVGGGGGVVLWDVATRERLSDDPLPVKEGLVRSVAFSPDGKTIAARYGGGGGTGVVLCDIELESWQRRAGQIANRNFTRDEWRQYHLPEVAKPGAPPPR
jgi:WD40 repeat protein